MKFLWFISAIFVLISACALFPEAYIFKCLDGCECDTDDEVIHCHNNPDRTRLQLPKTRLRGFTVLGLTHNNLRVLPSQELLQEKFPSLMAIDLEGNPDFECDTLEQYQRITVVSDCGKTPEEIAESRNRTTIETVAPATPECDMECQMRRHYDSMHEYLLRLWEIIKVKLAQLAKESKFFQDVKKFFEEMGKRVSQEMTKLTEDK
ncbi:hypothetical protein DdX_16218 [Ditylenchus destructor]|uniref:Uncharacterized protein n=1 Tax=Ditylenchus destructor TaxID=166010 RepID=A0AAD4R060_9BILA|nr:hypothetical protein DdX_16218 [Ditylenchus destructor]